MLKKIFKYAMQTPQNYYILIGSCYVVIDNLELNQITYRVWYEDCYKTESSFWGCGRMYIETSILNALKDIYKTHNDF